MLSMIAGWQQSRKSKKACCVENGINEATFYYWFSRIKENDTACGPFQWLRHTLLNIESLNNKDIKDLYPQNFKKSTDLKFIGRIQ